MKKQGFCFLLGNISYILPPSLPDGAGGSPAPVGAASASTALAGESCRRPMTEDIASLLLLSRSHTRKAVTAFRVQV